MLKPHSSDMQFIAITLVLVCLVGFQAANDLFYDESNSVSISSIEASDSKNILEESKRRPASVPEVAVNASQSSLEQISHFDFYCSKNRSLQEISVQGGFVQLEGKSCASGYNLNNVEITNRTNGYTASIFLKGSNAYQTDLIQLNQGENEIVVRYKEIKGQFVEQKIRVLSTKF